MSDAVAPKCTYCRKKPMAETYTPFCSKRCADLDLGQWLDGGYAIPTADSGGSEHDEAPEFDPFKVNPD